MTPAPCGHDDCTTHPAKVLDNHLVLPPNLVAYVLDLRVVRGGDKGDLSRKQAIRLMTSGALNLIDPRPEAQPRVTADELRRYITEGPRT